MTLESARPSPDIQPNKETEHPDPYAGLRTRILIATKDAIDPKQTLNPNDIQIAEFEDRDYELYENTTVAGRKRYWRKKEREAKKSLTYEEKYDQWEKSLLEGITQVREDPNSDWRKVLDPLLEKMTIGWGPNTQFEQKHADQLYKRYFPKDEEDPNKKGVKKFIRDVLNTYTKEGQDKPDTEDIKRLRTDLAKLQQFAVIFGEDESQMVTQLLLAEAEYQTNPDKVVTQAKTITPAAKPDIRINLLNEAEQLLLRDIKDANHKMPMMKYRKDIYEILAEARREHRVPVLNLFAETGAGKTVGGPQIIIDNMKPGETFVVTQPRRANAQSIPPFIAGINGWELGDKLGVHVKGNKRMSDENTIAAFMSEGVFERRLLNRENDAFMRKLAYVMFDETHIDTKEMEICMALVNDENERRMREGLQPIAIINASATASEKKLKRYYPEATTLKVEGRTFGVDDEFSPEPIEEDNIPEAMAKEFIKKLKDRNVTGDIAGSLAGVKHMNQVEKLLRECQDDDIRSAIERGDLQIIKYHSNSSEEVKKSLEEPAEPGKRRLILGTNAIETGVTIDGLEVMIVSGKKHEKIIDYDPFTGLEYMDKNTDQTWAELTQWRGRVGRNKRGTCYFLMTKEEFDRRKDEHTYPEPQMLRSNLTNEVLLFKNVGNNFNEYRFLSNVDMTHKQQEIFTNLVADAEAILKSLNALDDDGNITAIGKRIAELPTEVHFARMIAEAEGYTVDGKEKQPKGVAQVCTIAAIAEARNLFSDGSIEEENDLDDATRKEREKARRKKAKKFFLDQKSSDFLGYLRIWREFTKNKSSRKWAEENGLNYKALLDIKAIRKELLNKAETENDTPYKTEGEPDSRDQNISPEHLGLKKTIFSGLQDRLMWYNEKTKTYVWERANVDDLGIVIDKDSVVKNVVFADRQFIVAGNVKNKEITDEGQHKFTIENCHIVEKGWIPEHLLPEHLRNSTQESESTNS